MTHHPANVRRVLNFTALCLIAALPLAAGCRAPKAEPEKQSEPVAEKRETKLVVFAAASLRDAFGRLGDEFKKSHAGVELTFNFAGTQEIRTQLEQGAVADVFASADERHMKALVDGGKVEAPQLFAENEPVLVVATEKVDRIHSLADLPSVARIVIGVPEVPIGKYTLQILDKASTKLGSDFRSRVESHVVSRELNVRQVLAKVSLGEADAGFVYRSDVGATGGKFGVVTIPPELNVIARYPIAVVKGGPSPALGQAWVALVVSEPGRAILRAAGFIAPPETQAAR